MRPRNPWMTVAWSRTEGRFRVKALRARGLAELGFLDCFGLGFPRLVHQRRHPALGESQIQKHRFAQPGNEGSLVREGVSRRSVRPKRTRGFHQSLRLDDL